ncbi:hypothetical protein H5J24_20035 [Chryseobacterium capnotolerans]|uniref:hypothetical protein n=1 Tax=Chryseobacterium TaxID=59732 RepID=UPI00083AB1CA|nr:MULTISPECIES: hypothetical protein [Chryseobacterium]UHO37867.1 hypothetical protein H5J24_20035 [Chryseobacterium capnotolerans]
MYSNRTSFLILCCVHFFIFSYSQNSLENKKEDPALSVDTDILKAPASPASNLISIANSDINKPTDLSSLMINVMNLPLNFANEGGYAIDIAPYWLFPSKKRDKSVNQMLNDNIKYTLPQTLVFSFAVRNTDSKEEKIPANSFFTAVGFKFSINRGKPDSTTIAKFDAIKKLLNDRKKPLDEIRREVENSEEYKKLSNQRNQVFSEIAKDKYPNKKEPELTAEEKYSILNAPMYLLAENQLTIWKTQKINILVYENNETLKANAEKIKNVAFKINRIGFLWDFAGGTSIQFKDKQFNNSRIYNAGLWTVLGYASQKLGTPLLLLRYMYNPKSDWMTVEDFKPQGNFSTFDAGIKYEFSPKDSKFTASLEGLYRSFISGSDLKPTWKCVLNLDYALFPNQHLTLSLGKDFDNSFMKSGNVIAGLSFLSGIGSRRTVRK